MLCDQTRELSSVIGLDRPKATATNEELGAFDSAGVFLHPLSHAFEELWDLIGWGWVFRSVGDREFHAILQ